MTDETAMVPSMVDTTKALDIQQVKLQVQQVNHLLKEIMQVDQHYGKIPGCGDKPTLYQPGAQKIALLWGFGASYNIARDDHDGMHREYQVICKLMCSYPRPIGTCVRVIPPVLRHYWVRVTAQPRMTVVSGGSHQVAARRSSTTTQPTTTIPVSRWRRSERMLMLYSPAPQQVISLLRISRTTRNYMAVVTLPPRKRSRSIAALTLQPRRRIRSPHHHPIPLRTPTRTTGKGPSPSPASTTQRRG